MAPVSLNRPEKTDNREKVPLCRKQTDCIRGLLFCREKRNGEISGAAKRENTEAGAGAERQPAAEYDRGAGKKRIPQSYSFAEIGAFGIPLRYISSRLNDVVHAIHVRAGEIHRTML